jgi:hypothetical protein
MAEQSGIMAGLSFYPLVFFRSIYKRPLFIEWTKEFTSL